MKIDDPVAFLPGVRSMDAAAAVWLRQATLRLRREVCWLWRERAAQTGATGTQAGAQTPAADAGLPPYANPALVALDFARFADDKRAFFETDVTAVYLGRRIADAPLADGVGARGGFGWVVRELALSPAEAFVLALALLPAVDSAAGAVIACCLDDAQRSEPCLALAQRLWDDPDELLVCGDPGHTLARHGLVEPVAGWHSPLRMPAIVARELIRPQQGLPPSLQLIASLPVGHRPQLEDTRTRRVVPILGPRGAPLAQAAAQDALLRGQALIEPVGTCNVELLRSLATVAWLRGDALYLPPGTPSATPDGDAHGVPPAWPTLPVTLYLGFDERAGMRQLPPDALPAIVLPPACFEDRLSAWQAALPALADAPVLAEVAQRLRSEPSTIARLGAELRVGGGVPTADQILQAARTNLDLGSLAQRVAPRFNITELMLPPAQARQMDELVVAMRNLGRVHHRWGTARAWGESGLAALFAGPPGTGKTMACEALAQALDLPLWRIDLSQVVNKYVGETEKHLKQLFDGADACESILFFDEADALFGKRTEVRDAHDRYANLEVSYLLERMERFKGLAVLATNRRKDLDEAFLRRLRFVLEFPLPGQAERERIWRVVVPEGVDASELDIAFLARRFALAGGHIRAIVFQACLQSAAEGAPRRLTMQAVIRAVQREYEKLERAASLDQFGPYATLVADEKVMR